MLKLLRFLQLHHNLGLNDRIFISLRKINDQHLEARHNSECLLEGYVQLVQDVQPDLRPVLPVLGRCVFAGLFKNHLLGLSDESLLVSCVRLLVQIWDLLSDELVLEAHVQLQGQSLAGSSLDSRVAQTGSLV